MYHTVLPRQMMGQIVGGQQTNGQYPPTQTHTSPVADTNNNNSNTQQYNRGASYFSNGNSHYRHRLIQKNTCPLEIYQIMGVEIPPIRRSGYGKQNGGGNNSGHPSGNWQRRNIHSNNNSIGNNSLTIPPPHLNCRMNNNAGSIRKQNWNNNKYVKRNNNSNKDQTISAQNEINNYNSDSGISSRSPTPNKQTPDYIQTESSDDRESVSSCTDQEINKFSQSLQDTVQNDTILPPHGLISFMMQQQCNYNQRSPLSEQNHQGKKRYFGRGTPPMPKNQRGRKYTGILVPSFNIYPKTIIIPDRFDSTSFFIQPSKPPENLICNCQWDNLSKDVWKKFVTNQQTENTYRKKIMLWKYLLIHLKSIFPKYGLYLVGSTMNGFGSDSSDVDICLLVRNTDMIPRTEALWHLNQVLLSLQFREISDVIEQINFIPAKVPILKFRDRIQNLDVDLNCNNCVGVRNTHLLYCYSQIDWRVRPLVLVVKLWAQIQDINDAKSATISSYSLVLMVIHFLQCGVDPPVLPCLHSLFTHKFHSYTDIHLINIHEELNLPRKSPETINHQPLGELLYEFLRYYAFFDYASYAISVRTGRRLPINECRNAKSWKNDPKHWGFICIEEPFDLTNTARSVYNGAEFLRIQSVFQWSYQTLRDKRNLSSIFVTYMPRQKIFSPQ